MRRATPGTGAFRGGATSGTSYARFGQGIEQVTSFGQGSDGGRYTVEAGDTLASIALRLWGDAGLWYKLAQSNGLTAESTLIDGQTLTVPAGVVRNHYSASSLKPYDAADTLGDLSPTTPAPQAAAAKAKKNKCGAFGQILLAAVAIAVTAIAPFGGGVVASIANGVLGSVVSQGVGLATGIQDKFSFKGVALAGISAGVASGLDKLDAFAKLGIAGNGAVAAGARAAVTNVATQGIAVATGLQAKFDFAGVAVAGVVGGVGDAVARGLAGRNGLAGVKASAGSFGNQLASGAASAIAGAAARSLITGTSFGDNILAVLPDVIGSTIGRAVGESIAANRGGSAARSVTPVVLDDDLTLTPLPGITDGLAGSVPWIGAGEASATGTSAAPTAVSKGDAGQTPEYDGPDIVVTAGRPDTGVTTYVGGPNSGVTSKASFIPNKYYTTGPGGEMGFYEARGDRSKSYFVSVEDDFSRQLSDFGSLYYEGAKLVPIIGAADTIYRGATGQLSTAEAAVAIATLGHGSAAKSVTKAVEARAAERSLPAAVDLPNGGLSSASAWTKAARLRNAGSGIGLPSKEGYLRFVPPKNWSPERALPRGRAGGYLDRHGNEWMPDLVKGEWDVQLGRTGQGQLGYLSKNGRYLNVTPDGRISH